MRQAPRTDPDALARKFLLQGEYRLEDQIDLSHTFLYGHRFWPHLRTSDKAWTVTWNENDPTARFKMLHMQEVASACG